jgi:nucleoside-diphosphate-sugar epimerase
LIFGPPEQSVGSTTSLNTSANEIYQLINGKNKDLPGQGLPVFVDVRDVAEAHILALKNDSVIGKRVLLAGGPYTLYEVSVPSGTLHWLAH